MVREHAEKIAAKMKRIPFLRDVQFEQTLDYPTVEVDIDREKAGLSGVTVEDVRKALVMATSSTRFTNLNYWVDVKTGFDYLVQVQVPPLRMDKPEDVETLPIESVNPLVNLMVRDVATVRRGVRPGEYDRDMSQRYLTVTANVEGEDMGRASRQVAQAIAAAGKPPRGVPGRAHGPAPADDRDVQGARDRAGGRRVRDPRALDGLFPVAAPGADLDRRRAGSPRGHRDHPLLHQHLAEHRVVHGLDHVPGRLGVELGDARDVHERPLEGGEALDRGGRSSARSDRLRPILMTACAMTVGMVPMALALERGSEMQAPLGRAVIGGLVMSTFATLLVVPSIFALVIGRKAARSPSIYPDDPESPHYDPEVFAGEGKSGDEDPPEADQPVPSQPATRRKRPHPGRRPRGARTRRAPESPPLAWRSLMRRTLWPTVPDRSAGCRRLVFWLLAALVGAGLPPRGRRPTTRASRSPRPYS